MLPEGEGARGGAQRERELIVTEGDTQRGRVGDKDGEDLRNERVHARDGM